MGKKRAGPSAAIAPAQGKKMTFGDSDDENFVLPSAPVQASSPAAEDDLDDSGDDSDSDAAPEAVGMRAGAAVEKKRQEKADMERAAKRQAAKLRAARVAEAKLKAGKDKRKRPEPESDSDGGDSDESPEEARLRRRMEAAMAAGEGDSEMDDDEASEEGSDESDFDEEGEDDFDGLEEDDEEEDEEDEDEDDEDEEEEDEDEEDDDEEDEDEAGLLSAPVPKALRARMDAMMAAMETRAMSSDPKFADEMARRRAAGPVTEVPKLKSALKAAPARGTKITFDAEGLDLAPGVAPLSADLLAEADASLAADKAVSAARESDERRNRKRRRKNGNKGKKDVVSRQINDRTTVHLLPPVLGSGAAMPPVVGPRERVASAGKNLRTFYSRAMRGSGQIPGRGIADGRKRLPK